MTLEALFQQMVNAFPTLADEGKIFFDHVTVQDGDEVLPDYIVLTETQSDPFFADNQTYYLTVAHSVTLYTFDYNIELMQSIEEFLNARLIPFTRSVEWSDEMAVYITVYGVNLEASKDVES